ncbi:MAG: Holliday junction resolvase RuvX [Bryobacteraceae bacterium]|nr:Holliday junction resolvase RuvX [Bryobacteraceae bacterium]
MSNRILALDLGKKRIGFAVSDPLGITAQGLPTYTRGRIREDRAYLQQIAKQWEVSLFLLGNPLHMNGQESRGSQHARDFGDRLTEWTGVPVEYWDERWTSKIAGQVLRESGMGIDKRAAQVDMLSAVLILESYLDARAYAKNEEASA